MSRLTTLLNVTIGFLSPAVVIFWSLIRICTWPSLTLYRYWNEALFSVYMRAFLFFFEYWNIKKIYVYGDVDYFKHKNERVLYIANHLSTADWFMCSILVARQGGLGRTRFVLHKMLKYIPIFGFYLAQDSCLYVDRSNFKPNDAIATLEHIKSMQSDVWMAIYPEGTRYNPEHKDVIKKSDCFAEQNSIVPFKHHLTPRIRGFQLLFDHLRDYVDTIYDVCVVYADENGRPLDHRTRAPQLTNWFDHRYCVHVHITRIPIESLPTESDKVQSWLYSRFRIKDEFVENLQSRFHGSNQNHCVQPNGYVKHTDPANGLGMKKLPASPRGDLPESEADVSLVQEAIIAALPNSLDKRTAVLPPLRLIHLLPSVILFYGFSLYWLLFLGWFGVLSFTGVAIAGSVLGCLYVHYLV